MDETAPRDVAAAAAWLGVSTSWLYKQAAARRVPHSRVAGGQIRFTQAHLDAILAAGEQAVITTSPRLSIVGRSA